MSQEPINADNDTENKDSPGAQTADAGTKQPRVDRGKILAKDGKTVAAWALRFIIVIVALYILSQLLGYIWVGLFPLILALIFATVLWQPVGFLRKHRWPAALATLTVLLVFIAIVGAVVALVVPTIADQFQILLEQSQSGISQILNWLQNGPLKIDASQVQGAIDQIIQFLQHRASNIASGVISGLSAASNAVVTLFMAFVLMFFILTDGDKFLPWVRKYTGEVVGWHLTEVCTRSWRTLSGYIKTQAIVSAVDAILIGLGLVVLKVPMALALAFITFLAGFIPIVGAFTAGALAVLIALVSNGPINAVLVLALIIFVQQLEGNVLSPLLQSKAMGLHAAVVLLAVTVGSALFGIVGAFLAVPAAAVIAVWFRYHAEMVSLRAGEITADDIKVVTEEGNSSSASDSLKAFRKRLRKQERRSKPEKTDE